MEDNSFAQGHRGKGRPIAASEIPRFLYCERSWWYSVRGEISSEQARMRRGADRHAALAREVRAVERAQVWAMRLIWLLLALIIVVLALWLGVSLV